MKIHHQDSKNYFHNEESTVLSSWKIITQLFTIHCCDVMSVHSLSLRKFPRWFFYGLGMRLKFRWEKTWPAWMFAATLRKPGNSKSLDSQNHLNWLTENCIGIKTLQMASSHVCLLKPPLVLCPDPTHKQSLVTQVQILGPTSEFENDQWNLKAAFIMR